MLTAGDVIVVLTGPAAQMAVTDLVTWGHSSGLEIAYFKNGSYDLGPMTEVEADEVPELTYSVLTPTDGMGAFDAQQIAEQLAHDFGTSGTIVHDPFDILPQASSQACSSSPGCTLAPSAAPVQPGEG